MCSCACFFSLSGGRHGSQGSGETSTAVPPRRKGALLPRTAVHLTGTIVRVSMRQSNFVKVVACCLLAVTTAGEENEQDARRCAIITCVQQINHFCCFVNRGMP